jgi:hypothetical protein
MNVEDLMLYDDMEQHYKKLRDNEAKGVRADNNFDQEDSFFIPESPEVSEKSKSKSRSSKVSRNRSFNVSNKGLGKKRNPVPKYKSRKGKSVKKKAGKRVRRNMFADLGGNGKVSRSSIYSSSRKGRKKLGRGKNRYK